MRLRSYRSPDVKAAFCRMRLPTCDMRPVVTSPGLELVRRFTNQLEIDLLPVRFGGKPFPRKYGVRALGDVTGRLCDMDYALSASMRDWPLYHWLHEDSMTDERIDRMFTRLIQVVWGTAR